jgi:hypothetical protein
MFQASLACTRWRGQPVLDSQRASCVPLRRPADRLRDRPETQPGLWHDMPTVTRLS